VVVAAVVAVVVLLLWVVVPWVVVPWVVRLLLPPPPLHCPNDSRVHNTPRPLRCLPPAVAQPVPRCPPHDDLVARCFHQERLVPCVGRVVAALQPLGWRSPPSGAVSHLVG